MKPRLHRRRVLVGALACAGAGLAGAGLAGPALAFRYEEPDAETRRIAHGLYSAWESHLRQIEALDAALAAEGVPEPERAVRVAAYTCGFCGVRAALALDPAGEGPGF